MMHSGDSGNVVVFGAGASAFGPGVHPKNPPLGNRLFNELVQCFPEVWGAMQPDLAARFEPDFEAGMRFIWQAYPMAVQPAIPGIPAPYELMKTMGEYFLQFEPDGTRSDLYLRFVNALYKNSKLDKVRLATLNYENLLESALSAIGQAHRVLRPHGAVNWWVHGPTLRAGVGRALGQGFHCVGQRVRPIRRTDVLRSMKNEGKYPAMAIYMPGKRTQMGQRKLLNHRIRFQRIVSIAERIAVVGLRPYPPDEHIWGALAHAPADLYYVGDQAAFEDWRKEFRCDRKSVWIGPKFEKAINKLVSIL